MLLNAFFLIQCRACEVMGQNRGLALVFAVRKRNSGFLRFGDVRDVKTLVMGSVVFGYAYSLYKDRFATTICAPRGFG